jgi:uncharacterized membrane protein
MPTRPNGLWRKASFSLFSQIFFTLSTHMLATMSIRKKEAGMKTWQWVSIIVVALVVCVIGAVIGPFFAFGRGGSGYGMMNGYGNGMMGGSAPFGLIGMLLMWVFPLGVLVLVVFGIVWLVNAVSRPKSQSPVAPAKTCPNCTQPVQADWRNCPHCGTALEG